LSKRCLRDGNEQLARGDYKRAIASYDRAILKGNELYTKNGLTVQPSGVAYYNRGLAKAFLGEMDEATNDFNCAHQLDSSIPPAITEATADQKTISAPPPTTKIRNIRLIVIILVTGLPGVLLIVLLYYWTS